MHGDRTVRAKMMPRAAIRTWRTGEDESNVAESPVSAPRQSRDSGKDLTRGLLLPTYPQ